MSEPTAPKMSFIYRICNDVEEMRNFYSDIIGLKELTFKNDEQGGWVVYSNGGLTIQFWKWDEELPVDKEWSWQPGNCDGTSPALSWAFEVTETQMKNIYMKMKSAGVSMFHGKPKWFGDNNYWGLKVKDPMGFTIDIHWSPEKKSLLAEWPE